MMRMVPLKKQSKKKQREYHAKQRGSWYGLNPVTRTVPSRKAYDRNRIKRADKEMSARFYLFDYFNWLPYCLQVHPFALVFSNFLYIQSAGFSAPFRPAGRWFPPVWVVGRSFDGEGKSGRRAGECPD